MSHDGPYPRPYISSDPSAQNKTGKTGSLQTRKGRGVVPLESEEDLIYYTGESKSALKDNEIMKMTEFKVTERGPGEDSDVERVEKVHVALKPWERQER